MAEQFKLTAPRLGNFDLIISLNTFDVNELKTPADK